jgi:hypothetical protein
MAFLVIFVSRDELFRLLHLSMANHMQYQKLTNLFRSHMMRRTQNDGYLLNVDDCSAASKTFCFTISFLPSMILKLLNQNKRYRSKENIQIHQLMVGSYNFVIEKYSLIEIPLFLYVDQNDSLTNNNYLSILNRNSTHSPGVRYFYILSN